MVQREGRDCPKLLEPSSSGSSVVGGYVGYV